MKAGVSDLISQENTEIARRKKKKKTSDKMRGNIQ